MKAGVRHGPTWQADDRMAGKSLACLPNSGRTWPPTDTDGAGGALGWLVRGEGGALEPEPGNYRPTGSPCRTVTTVWMPPRTMKSPVTSMNRGASAATRSSQMRFVTASWNAPSSR